MDRVKAMRQKYPDMDVHDPVQVPWQVFSSKSAVERYGSCLILTMTGREVVSVALGNRSAMEVLRIAGHIVKSHNEAIGDGPWSEAG